MSAPLPSRAAGREPFRATAAQKRSILRHKSGAVVTIGLAQTTDLVITLPGDTVDYAMGLNRMMRDYVREIDSY